MKRIDVMIWKCLVEDLGEYVSSEEMCLKLGLTKRQLLTRVTKLNFPSVEKSVEKYSGSDYETREQYFRLNCTPQTAQEHTMHILAKYYKCDEDQLDSIIKSVPVDHSITLDEVTYNKEAFSLKDIVCIFSIVPCINQIPTWSKNRYQRRDLGVQQYT